MTAIDIHNHIVPEGFPVVEPTCGGGRWPSLQKGENNEASIMIGGKEFRRIDSRSWDIQRRTGDMDEERVDVHVISPMPELLSYWFDGQDGLKMGRHINAAIGEMVHKAPTRFLGMGMVPLQDPDLAAKELSKLKNDGFVGIEIGSNINGKVPGDPLYEPFFAEVERLGLAVLVHAFHPLLGERIIGPAMATALIGFPTEIGLAAASVISSGLLERHPNLRMAFSHGGGTLAAILPRLNHGWTLTPFKGQALSPLEVARKLYFDTLVFDPVFLKHLIERFGASQVMIGTDYPYTLRQAHPVDFLEKLGLTSGELESITSANAKRFLGL
jgi:aminocarboxymuconate-semialdehyde decarboxylase